MNVGDKILRLKNSEDINSVYILEIIDVYEVGYNETYYETIKYNIKNGKKNL